MSQEVRELRKANVAGVALHQALIMSSVVATKIGMLMITTIIDQDRLTGQTIHLLNRTYLDAAPLVEEAAATFSFDSSKPACSLGECWG